MNRRHQLPAVIRQTFRLPDGADVVADLRLVCFRHVAHPRYRVRVDLGDRVVTAQLEVEDALGFVDEVVRLAAAGRVEDAGVSGT